MNNDIEYIFKKGIHFYEYFILNENLAITVVGILTKLGHSPWYSETVPSSQQHQISYLANF